ncbi:HTH-type 3 domain-containing protein [Gottschalkia acidurici 9a]|uniref:HTH-type 3 domain-containing protein n=1 Tax=Gottschalkia acidurici (strain ATCC 7906 / DSM 604 / BCRC 14475 / CIP 104303 / KCTC 5404 / NCIMB 10678 / 9a) TaxID=1128398 RepID=K0AYM4_GOTA9|nr:helix-turn-helix transcriptional regulator [Gottschalkia acidurici]AFS77511.1 HTH-type 3 domain-containing protein [Gottschalkia acidurici 9a]
MEKNTQIQINHLQQNLMAIRKIAGWTAEEFGAKIGVTKQTISNLENKRTPMNLTQYIAIRAILDYEIANNKENTVLPQVVTILLDKADEFDEKDYNKLKEAISAVSISAAGGITGATLASMFAGLLAPIGIIGAGLLGPIGSIAGGTAYWLKKIIGKTDKK